MIQRLLLSALASLVACGMAHATVFVTERGSFTALTSAAASGDWVQCPGASKISFVYDTTGGTFTANLQLSMTGTGATPTDVAGSSSSTDLAQFEIDNPNGLYRPELSACSSCSVVVSWLCVNQR